jgi:hypothetical protein
MDFVQELVSNFCHMATRKCKTCGEYKPFRDYDGSQWCPAPEGPQEKWVQMALYGGAFVFGVLADVLEARNLRECEGRADVSESADQKQLNRKNTWQRCAAPRTDQHSTGKASILDGNVFYLTSESDPCGGQGVGDRGPAAALINMAGVRALVKVTNTLSTLSLSLSPSLLSLSTTT